MLLLRTIVTLGACCLVACDLLDLYVQHMDETMRTMLYRSKRHPADPASRIKRSLEVERAEPLLRVGNFKKQRLDVDEEWLKQWKAKKKIMPFKNDALDSPNERENNLDPDQHEILLQGSTRGASRYLEEETTTDAMYLNIVKDETKWEKEDAIFPPVARSPTDELEESTVEPLEPEGTEIGTEGEENSQFEIIDENGEIEPRPSFKRPPSSRGGRAPKKYFPSAERSAKRDGRKSEGLAENSEVATKSGRIKRGAARASKFIRYEKLDDNGDVVLEWDPTDDEEVTFKVTARTLGYVGIGFNEKRNMKGADILIAWVDDHTGTVHLLVSPAHSSYSDSVASR